MSEHLENLRRCLDRMEGSLEPYNDRDSAMIDMVAHMKAIVQQAKLEVGGGAVDVSKHSKFCDDLNYRASKIARSELIRQNDTRHNEAK